MKRRGRVAEADERREVKVGGSAAEEGRYQGSVGEQVRSARKRR